VEHPEKAAAMKDKGRAMIQLEVDMVHSDKQAPLP
jgi:hypothetical protein